MGWLRRLMQGARPPIRSYGELSRRVLATPDWPDASRPKPRSLAALFSKLDRDQELEWLADRPGVQVAVAEALGQPLSEVSRALGALERATSEAGLLGFEDVPFARSLELAREPLCPGIPRELTVPATWRRCWWHAPEGSGRAWLDAWLEARGSCRVVRASTLAEAFEALEGQLPTLLSVEAPGDANPARLHGAPALCVAAPFTLEQARSQSHHSEWLPENEWQLIASPGPEHYLTDLVTWLDQRLADGSSFDAAASIDWLRRVPLAQGFVDSLETLLGLCGALDEVDARKLGNASASRLAEQFFRQRMSRLGAADSTRLSWLRRAGIEVLVDLCARLLMDAGGGWSQPRAFDAWLDLVPLEHQRGGDLDWMRLALLEENSPIRPGDITRAAQRLPPGAFRVVQALEQSGFLRKEAEGLLALRPRWFGRALLDAARRRLLAASPLEWGEVLLNRHEAEPMFWALVDRLLAHDFQPAEAVLELESNEDPAAVASIEASFVGAGLAVLSGAELPSDLLEGLWNEQLELMLDFDAELPRARLLFAAPASPNAGLFAQSTLHISALALSEQLPEGSGRQHPLLRPWSRTTPPALLGKLYDAIADWLGRRALPAPLTRAALLLVDRLRATLGQCAREPHALERPGLLLDEVEHEVLSFGSVEAVLESASGVTWLVELAAGRGYAWPRVARSIWEAWDRAGRPARAGELLGPQSVHARHFWGAIPAALLSDLLGGDKLVEVPPQLFQSFQPEQYRGLLQLEPERLHRYQEAFWLMPEEVATEWLTRLEARTDAGLVPLWARFSERLSQVVRQALSEHHTERALELMQTAPDSHTERLVALLERHVNIQELKPQAMRLLRSWLVVRSSARGEGWRAAYALLCKVEDALAPMRAGR